MMFIGIFAFTIAVVILVYVVFAVAKNKDRQIEKFKSMFNLLVNWDSISDKHVVEYLEKRDISSIAIYGAGNLGKILCNRLKDSDINILYFVDVYCMVDRYDQYPIFHKIQNNIKVDAIIITPIWDYISIKDSIEKSDICSRVISLKEIIYGE